MPTPVEATAPPPLTAIEPCACFFPVEATAPPPLTAAVPDEARPAVTTTAPPPLTVTVPVAASGSNVNEAVSSNQGRESVVVVSSSGRSPPAI